MTEDELHSYLDRTVEALEGMAPGTNWPVLIAAFLAFLIGLFTLWQKSRSDARSEWWRRTQWALEATNSERDRPYAQGTELLRIQAKSRLAGADELEFLNAVWEDSETSVQGTDEVDEVSEYLREMGVNPRDQEIVTAYLSAKAEAQQSLVDEPPGNSDNEDTEEERP
ncbi:hypothetical protein [Arthrobacter koreensis]|uniref:hypothetical protein n=1 Tax=Arthrobacter koreensis TaxID=199136 RepID=UPI003825392C